MASNRVMETYIRNDPWVQSLKEAPDVAALTELLMARARTPAEVGPYISPTQGEHPYDLVVELVDVKQIATKRISDAISSIIVQMTHCKMREELPVLQCLFYLAVQLHLDDCAADIYQWLQNRRKLYADVAQVVSVKGVYRDALWALASLQKENDPLEANFWYSFWSDNSYWWYVAYLGMIYREPKEAIKRLPEMIMRKVEGASDLLRTIWFQKSARPELERQIKIGLAVNNRWAGYALNILASDLSNDMKKKLLENLKAIDFSIPGVQTKPSEITANTPPDTNNSESTESTKEAVETDTFDHQILGV